MRRSYRTLRYTLAHVNGRSGSLTASTDPQQGEAIPSLPPRDADELATVVNVLPLIGCLLRRS